MQSAAFVEPGDAAAAGANFDDIKNRNANGQSLVIAADKIIGRETRLAAPDHAGLGRRPAHVKSDGSFEIEHLAQRHGADDAPCGSRLHHLDALVTRQFDVGKAAVGLHDQGVAGEFIASQPSFEVA